MTAPEPDMSEPVTRQILREELTKELAKEREATKAEIQTAKDELRLDMAKLAQSPSSRPRTSWPSFATRCSRWDSR
jgi:hypothetical protein